MDCRVPEDELAAQPPPPPGLAAEQEQGWLRMRRGVGRRHQIWRTGMPGLEELFDDDAHRARALAGNLATELGDVLRTTAATHPGAIVAAGSPTPWVDGACSAWLESLRGLPVARGWSPEAAGMFEAMLSELVEREHGRAVAAARQVASAEGPRSSRPLIALMTRLAAPLRRFLRPD